MKYMYFKLSTRKLRQSAVLVFLLFMSVLAKAQADFTMTPVNPCSGIDLTTVTVTTPGIAPADLISFTIRWGLPNDTAVNAKIVTQPPSPNFLKTYLAGGIYNVTVVVKRTNGPDIVITKQRKVWERPTTRFVMASRDTQCFKNNEYCFTNISKQGTAPLVRYDWTYGDGNALTLTDTNIRVVCHKYNISNPSFNVGLKVTDSVGCTTDPQIDALSARAIAIAPDIKPSFTITGSPRCDSSKYIFTNTTPLGFANTKFFLFDFGDGKKYVSGPPNTTLTDLNTWTKPFVHTYYDNNVFYPYLIVEDRRYACADTFYYRFTGKPLPENIIYQVEILTKRADQDFRLADSVCFKKEGEGSVTLYNNGELTGKGGTKLGFVWSFNDPYEPQATNYIFQGVDQPTYKYKGLGQFFPTLTVVCPGAPPIAKTYTFYSKIDTLPKDRRRYQYEDYAIPNGTASNQNSYVVNPILYSRNGKILTPNTPTNPQYFNFNGKISKYAYDTAYSPVDPTLILSVTARHIGWSDSMSSSWDYFKTNNFDCANKYTTTTNITFRNPFTSTLITVPFNKEFCNPTSLAFSHELIGLGVNILGPNAQIENPPLGPDPPFQISKWQKIQCGPTYKVQFTNNTTTYQSDRLWMNWDFGEQSYAPACTSFSIPNPSAANGGLPPYADAAEMQGRTFGGFVANGRSYFGRYNACNFSSDTLPEHTYVNWDKVLIWNKYGHDFPPYDSTRWTKSYTKWPPAGPAPAGFNWVHPTDTGTWNKPVTAIGPVPTRLDTMLNIWPPDITPNTLIVLTRGIPDPISAARGNWMDQIPNGTRIDTGLLNINLSLARDKRLRRYKGNDTVPGINPVTTLYDYAFRRQVIQDITVTLKEKDSLNNSSGDPGYRLRKVKPDTLLVYDPFTKTMKDSIVFDSLMLDEWDCNASGTATLSFTRPDAFGLSQDGRVCPGRAAGDFGGTAKLIFDNAGFIDTTRTTRSAGILPSSNRTFLQINYDSLLDRHDNTPCVLDQWVGFGGGVTPGGMTMPPMWNSLNYTPPPQAWTSASGSSTFVSYYPNGGSPVGASNMPYDKRGWITIGLRVGTGCADIPACTTPDCISDPVWYHKFFRVIELEAAFVTANFTYENVDFSAKTSMCYLRAKGDDVTFHYKSELQDNVIADVWNWGDGTATIDSFYFQDGADIPYNRIRYNFNALTLPWEFTYAEYFPVGVRIAKDTVIEIKYDCADINKLFPKYDTIINIRDSSLLFTPITHKYYKSSFENMVFGGSGNLERKGDITEVQHVMVTNTYSRCKSFAKANIVIGVIDTFDILNSDGVLDTVFCEGQTVYFRDSIRYWYPSTNCSRPLNVPANENNLLNHDQGNMHQWAYTRFNWPLDSIRPAPLYDFTDYKVFPASLTICPIGYGTTNSNPRTPVIINNDKGTPLAHCYKERKYFYERVYWDFESDGVIDHLRPNTPLPNTLVSTVTHKYPKYGRYKVTMYSIDSTGKWDTCFQYVNVVKPIAKIDAKDRYICGDRFIFKDSTQILQNYADVSDTLDRIAGWKWWFGDRVYNSKLPQSILEDPIYDYRKNGKYTLRIAINTVQGCTDTAFKDIFVVGPRPHLVILDDTLGCVPHRVRVVSIPEREIWSDPTDTPTKLTIIRSGRPDKLFVPIKYSTIDTAVFFYDQPGTYYISAEAYITEDGSASACRPIFTPDTVDGFEKPIKITVNVPYKVDMLSSKDTVCVGEVFRLFNFSDRDTITRYRMDVFNANFGTRIDSVLKTNFVTDTTWQYKFNSVGQYKLVLNSTRFRNEYSPCANYDTITMVAAKSKAGFSATEAGEGKFRLINTSDTIVSDKYTWKIYNPDGTMYEGFPKDFDESSDLNDFVQTFNIDSSRSFNVCIIADVAGSVSCPDSTCQIIQVILPKSKINIPNVFTPNGDGKNDEFNIQIVGYKKYALTIWNRWGNTVFESDNAEKMWNGKTNNDGAENPAGTYYYLFTYQLRGGEEKTVRGSITLIRQ